MNSKIHNSNVLINPCKNIGTSVNGVQYGDFDAMLFYVSCCFCWTERYDMYRKDSNQHNVFVYHVCICVGSDEIRDKSQSGLSFQGKEVSTWNYCIVLY